MVFLLWCKSSHSRNASNDDACIELAHVDTAVALRDSKAPTEGALILNMSKWSQLSTRLDSANHTA